MSDKISISCDWSQWNCLCEWVLRIMNGNCYFSDYGHILTISTPKSQQVPDFQQGLKLGAFDSKSCGQVFWVFLLSWTPKTHSACWALRRKGKGGRGEIRLCAFGSFAAADEQPADGVIPPQTSTSGARANDALQYTKAARGFVFRDG